MTDPSSQQTKPHLSWL